MAGSSASMPAAVPSSMPASSSKPAVKRAARPSIGTCMTSKSAGSAPDGHAEADPPGKRAASHAISSATSAGGRSGSSSGHGAAQPSRHRLEAPARGLQRVGQVPVEPAVVLARHHAVEAVLRRPAPPGRAARRRWRPRRGRCAGRAATRPTRERTARSSIRSACLRASRGARSSGSAPASAPCSASNRSQPSSSAANERGSPIITSNNVHALGPGDEGAERVALVERDVRARPALARRRTSSRRRARTRRGRCCGRGLDHHARVPLRVAARGSGARSRATSRAPTRCGRRVELARPPATAGRRGG